MNADSVKDRLKNYAEKNEMSFQEVLGYYGLERFLYRLSVSNYSKHFILKGGILLYAIFDGNYQRATADIDLLAKRLSNSAHKIASVFQEIISIECDDAIRFDPNSLKVQPIAEWKKYHGFNIKAIAFLDKTKIPISIDIGYGDAIFPAPTTIEFPTILEKDPILLSAYSIESVIAEKLSAIVINGMLNTRYKDFYDIYVLLKSHLFSEVSLADALVETFQNRRLTLPLSIDSFEDEFVNDPIHTRRWDSFIKKKRVIEKVSLLSVVTSCKQLLYPVLSDLKSGTIQDKVWDPHSEMWVTRLTKPLLEAQKAFAGVAEELGLKTEEDIQKIVDEMRGK